MKKINKMSAQTRENLLRASAQRLPDRPTAAGMSPDDIRRTLWMPMLGSECSLATEQDRVVEEVNEVLTDVEERLSACAERTERTEVVISGVFDERSGNNLLDPSNAESGFYEGVASVANVRYQRTVTPINIEGNTGVLYFKTNVSTDGYVCQVWLDSAGAHIESTSSTFAIIYNDKNYALRVPEGCTQLHLWISGTDQGNTLGNVCVSLKSLEEFEEYAPEHKLKKEALPEGVAQDIEALKEGTTVLKEDTTVLKEDTERLSRIGDLFEVVHGNNLLDPSNAESGFYEGATPVAKEGYQRTVSPISIDGNRSSVHIRSNSATSGYICVVWLDSAGAHIKSNSTTFAEAAANDFALLIPDGCTQMHFWISGADLGNSLANVCVSYESLEDFEAYAVGAFSKLREEALPEGVAQDMEALKEGTSTLKEDAERLRPIGDLFEVVHGNNLLDPSNAESGFYQGTTPVAKEKYQRTVTPINIEGNTGVLYFKTNVSTDGYVCQVWLDSAGAHIESTSSTFAIIYNDKNYALRVPEGCTQLHLWISGADQGNTLGNVCVSLKSLEEFEEYAPEHRLKKEALPEGAKVVLPLEGKTVVNFGDSIFGNFRAPVDISTFLADATGATVYNCGFGGCRMAKHNMSNYDAFGMYRLSDAIASKDFSVQDAALADTGATEVLPWYFADALALLKSIDFSEVDIVTIAYGTNDFTGTNDLDDPNNTHSTERFTGALRYSIETLLGAYPHLRIFLCTPTYRFWFDDTLTSVGYTFSSDTVFDSDTCANNRGETLTDYVEAVKEIANAYHLPCIDNYYRLGFNNFNRSVYFPATDGTHPNEAGRGLIAAHIAHTLF